MQGVLLVGGPSSAPDDLAERLQARGLRLLDTYEGVALPLSAPLPDLPPGVEVQPVEDEPAVRAMIQINAQIWGYSQADQERIVAERMAYLASPDRQGGYLLSWVGGQPAGTANYRFSSDGQVLYLTGTSAPILARLGFAHYLTLRVFAGAVPPQG